MPVRVLNRSALCIVGVLKRRRQSAVTVEQMNDALAYTAAKRHAREFKLAAKPNRAITRKHHK